MGIKLSETKGSLLKTPTSLAAKRAEWQKLVKLWDKVVHYIEDPKTQDDAVKIMAARSGVDSDTYKSFLKGTKLLDLKEGKKVFAKGEGLESLYGSTAIANGFNVKYEVYKESQGIEGYIDPSLTDAAQ